MKYAAGSSNSKWADRGTEWWRPWHSTCRWGDSGLLVSASLLVCCLFLLQFDTLHLLSILTVSYQYYTTFRFSQSSVTRTCRT